MERVCLSLVLVSLAACDFPRLPRLAANDPGLRADAAVDGAAPGCTSFATLLALDTCELAFDGDLAISSGTAVYDTGTHVLTVGGAAVPVPHTTVVVAGDAVEVISARSVTLASGTRLRAEGMMPLVIAASGDIIVSSDAMIDVSDGGAGAQTSCTGGAAPGAADSGGGAGGGGGGYGADGGRGGDGDSDGGRSPGGAKGVAVSAVSAGLRGGCPGASGGAGRVDGGGGGKAGGALYLVAAGRIELQQPAVLNAGGGGGAGGPHAGGAGGGDTGGGGGGSGGMLLLEAPHVIGPNALIAANGGGGGGGGDSGVAGEAGAPGTVTTARASGGRGTSSIFTTGSGIDGGRGGSRPSPAGEDVTAVDIGGGGGGGGGVGIIRVKSADLQLGVISPDPR